MDELKEMNAVSFAEDQLEVYPKEEQDSTETFSVMVRLTPNDGLYRDGEFMFEIIYPSSYPVGAPTVRAASEIFHPNVAYTGEVCFNIIGDDSVRLADMAHGLLWLLYYPNLYSRMNCDCPRDEQQFARMVRASIRGEVVAGHVYKGCLVKREAAEDSRGKGEASPGDVANLKTERDGKVWEWKLVGEEWKQVFRDSLSPSA